VRSASLGVLRAHFCALSRRATGHTSRALRRLLLLRLRLRLGYLVSTTGMRLSYEEGSGTLHPAPCTLHPSSSCWLLLDDCLFFQHLAECAHFNADSQGPRLAAAAAVQQKVLQEETSSAAESMLKRVSVRFFIAQRPPCTLHA
jgi:hypothetical protein